LLQFYLAKLANTSVVTNANLLYWIPRIKTHPSSPKERGRRSTTA